MKTVSHLVQSEKQPFTAAVRAFLPRSAVVPFNLLNRHDFDCVVQENESVSEGQVIALKLGDETHRNTYLHSPLPGRVVALEQCPLPDGRQGMGIRIRLEGTFSYLGRPPSENEWQWLTPDELLSAFAEKGVVNTFGAPEPLHEQIAACTVRQGRLLVVRMFDDDPSHSTDAFVARHYTEEVATGALIVSRAMKAQGIVFAMPRKDAPAIALEGRTTTPCFFMEVDERKYPSGFVQNLMQLIKKAPKTEEQRLFNDVNHRSIFVDPETLYAVYEAVVLGKPVVETFVQVTGSCLDAAALFRVRIGTTLGELAQQCGGFTARPSKAIMNGTVTGTAVQDFRTAVTAHIKSVAFVTPRELRNQSFAPCIRCGKCRRICPEGLYPDLMLRHSLGGKPVGTDLLATADLCSGCSLCNGICPSRLPLSQTIELMRKLRHETH